MKTMKTLIAASVAALALIGCAGSTNSQQDQVDSGAVLDTTNAAHGDGTFSVQYALATDALAYGDESKCVSLSDQTIFWVDGIPEIASNCAASITENWDSVSGFQSRIVYSCGGLRYQYFIDWSERGAAGGYSITVPGTDAGYGGKEAGCLYNVKITSR